MFKLGIPFRLTQTVPTWLLASFLSLGPSVPLSPHCVGISALESGGPGQVRIGGTVSMPGMEVSWKICWVECVESQATQRVHAPSTNSAELGNHQGFWDVSLKLGPR